MKYLTFDDFITMGGALTDSEFNRFEFRGERLIDNLTQGRLKNADTIPEAVKRCMFELVNYLSNNAKNGDTSAISGFSNDGYSVTYAQQKSAAQQVHDIVYDYLSNTELMYCGVE